MRRFKVGSPVYLAMVESLNRRTQAGCKESLTKALLASTAEQKVGLEMQISFLIIVELY
jgi:hypothetical protein